MSAFLRSLASSQRPFCSSAAAGQDGRFDPVNCGYLNRLNVPAKMKRVPMFKCLLESIDTCMQLLAPFCRSVPSVTALRDSSLSWPLVRVRVTQTEGLSKLANHPPPSRCPVSKPHKNQEVRPFWKSNNIVPFFGYSMVNRLATDTPVWTTLPNTTHPMAEPPPKTARTKWLGR